MSEIPCVRNEVVPFPEPDAVQQKDELGRPAQVQRRLADAGLTPHFLDREAGPAPPRVDGERRVEHSSVESGIARTPTRGDVHRRRVHSRHCASRPLRAPRLTRVPIARPAGRTAAEAEPASTPRVSSRFLPPTTCGRMSSVIWYPDISCRRSSKRGRDRESRGVASPSKPIGSNGPIPGRRRVR